MEPSQDSDKQDFRWPHRRLDETDSIDQGEIERQQHEAEAKRRMKAQRDYEPEAKKCW